ncbi:MAG: hypothetical protein JNM09_20975 [Blastocatellia bacterium]|nr:hypothetical protein [Blastocatellia bacterium]
MGKSISFTLHLGLSIFLVGAALAQSGRAPQSQSETRPKNAGAENAEQRSGNRPESQRQGPEIPNLTDEQKGQLQTIRQQSREQIETVRSDSTLSDEERRTRIDSIRQNSREQSQSVLTPEQREAVASQRGNGEGRGNRRPGTNGQGDGERPAGANGQGQQGGNRPQMGGQNGGFGGGGLGGPRGGQGGPPSRGGRGGNRP